MEELKSEGEDNFEEYQDDEEGKPNSKPPRIMYN